MLIIEIFGKPFLKSYRRMGVILAPSLDQAKKAAKKYHLNLLSKFTVE